MRILKGTPKDLRTAIKNGLEEYGFLNNEKIIKVLLPHIQEFMAQKAVDRDPVKHEAMRVFFYKIFKEVL